MAKGYNEHSLRFRTGAIAAFQQMISAMVDMSKQFRLVYTKEGLMVNECVANNSLLMVGNFEACAFQEYETTGAGVLCFNQTEAKFLMDCLAQNTSRDEMVWTYKHDSKKQFVSLRILHDSESEGGDGQPLLEDVYEIAIVNGHREVQELEQEEHVDYVCKVNGADICGFFEYLKKTEDEYDSPELKFLCMPDRLVVEKLGGVDIPRASLTLKKPDSVKKGHERVIAEDAVFTTTSIENIKRLMKYFQITNRGASGDIWLMITQDRPIIFELQVGPLGSLRSVVVPYVMGE